MTGEELIGAGVFAMIMGMIVFISLLAISLYVYVGFAFMAIAKKAKHDNPALAWIPIVGPALISCQIAKMHWWPLLLLVGIFIPMLAFPAMIVYAVYLTIWQWKMFEKLKYPGWWAILCLISPLNLIFWGIAAWSKK